MPPVVIRGSAGQSAAARANQPRIEPVSWFDRMLGGLDDVELPLAGRLGDLIRTMTTETPADVVANAIAPLGMAMKPAAKAAGTLRSVLQHTVVDQPNLPFRRLKKALNTEGGFTIDPKTGQAPTRGTFVALHPNSDPRVAVIPKHQFTAKTLGEYVSRIQPELAGKERYLGGWVSGDNVYLDVPLRVARNPKSGPESAAVQARRIEAQERAAMVRGGGRKRTHADPAVRREAAQDAVFTVDTMPSTGMKGERFVGDWRGYIDSPLFERRAIEQANDGLRYLQEGGITNPEWWKLRGTTWEKVYADLPDGTMSDDRMQQVAAALSATAPNAGTTENVRQATEYLRRMLKHEPAIQPDWRAVPGVNATHLRAGSMMPMEKVRMKNLLLGREGRGAEMNAAKVREEFKALMGDPNAEVLDTHFAKIGEVPSSGVYINAAAGKIQGKEYEVMAKRLRGIAQNLGRDPRDWTAEVWTGIRENVKRHGELYGQKFKRAEGESFGYDQILDREIERTATTLGMTVPQVTGRLRAGDMNLLAALLSTGVLGPMVLGEEEGSQPSPVL